MLQSSNTISQLLLFLVPFKLIERILKEVLVYRVCSFILFHKLTLHASGVFIPEEWLQSIGVFWSHRVEH